MVLHIVDFYCKHLLKEHLYFWEWLEHRSLFVFAVFAALAHSKTGSLHGFVKVLSSSASGRDYVKWLLISLFAFGSMPYLNYLGLNIYFSEHFIPRIQSLGHENYLICIGWIFKVFIFQELEFFSKLLNFMCRNVQSFSLLFFV